MADNKTADNQIAHEVQRQFLRRTPIKLKQFARLLTDMIEQKVDAIRVKALLSQVTKTREACLTQEFELTARLLHQLIKQLSMSGESMESQRPLLKRLSIKLMEHSEKLELGVKPQKEVRPPVKKEKQATEELEDDSQEDQSSTDFDIYVDKGKLIFVADSKSNHNSENKALCEQFESMGVESCLVQNLNDGLTLAKKEAGSIVIAGLTLAEERKVLADEEIEQTKTPLIFIADEDNQFNRATALRNGGTGFIVEPVSISTIYQQIDRLYDLHADTPKRVLVMEDSKAQARYYEKVLNKGHFEVMVVSDPRVFLEALRSFDPETVLMDMQMPESSGVELTQMIRQMPRYSHLPIIFLSAEENMRKQNQALMSGGTAFIVKPVQKEQLMFMANLYTQRFRNLNPQIDVNPDTNLPYSAQFKQMIAIETARMSRNPSSIALAVVHLDELESLASGANYSFINSAILQLAQLLQKRLRKTDIIGHLDSGTLGVILTSGKEQDWIAIMKDVQLQYSDLLFQLENQDKSLTVSVGISELNSNYDAHQWIERSHHALATALQSGASSLNWYQANEN